MVPYSPGEVITFSSKQISSNQYEMKVLSKRDFEWESTRVIEHNTHLGIICENHDPLKVYYTKYNQTVFKTDFINNLSGTDVFGIQLSRDFNSGKALFTINNNVKGWDSNEGPLYSALSGSFISEADNSLKLNYNKIDSLDIGGVNFKNLYQIDSMYTSYFGNSGFEKDIYFLGALYSIEKGFVRFITKDSDTLDLRPD